MDTQLNKFFGKYATEQWPQAHLQIASEQFKKGRKIRQVETHGLATTVVWPEPDTAGLRWREMLRQSSIN